MASSRYNLATLEPGAKDDLTQGFRVKPNSFAFFASSPAATVFRGLEVLVQLVIAAIITAPSGIKPSVRCSTTPAMPLAFNSLVATLAWGLDGPAILRVTLDKSKVNTRG